MKVCKILKHGEFLLSLSYYMDIRAAPILVSLSASGQLQYPPLFSGIRITQLPSTDSIANVW